MMRALRRDRGQGVGTVSQGFTLIELLVTLAIIAIIAGTVIPLSEISVRRTKEQELRRALWELRDGIDAYKRAGDEGRILRSADASGYPPSLRSLIEGVPDAKNPRGGMLYFMRKIPRDPFETDPNLPPERTWGVRSFASPPDQPREGSDVFDVFSRNERISLSGVPYREW